MGKTILWLCFAAATVAACGDNIPQGPPGPEGPAGPPGGPGPEGPPGTTGAAGTACWDLDASGSCETETEDGNLDGACDALDCRGADGEVGAAGPIGPAGLQGDPGPAGDTGPPGADGAQGPPGPQGDVGPIGMMGPPGPQGDVGPAGPQGDVGPAGAQGVQGDVGPAGPAGSDGAAGPQGDIGPQGPPGTDGVQGDVGPAGPQGDIGPAGPQGDVGPQGPAGSANINGTTNRLVKFTSATTGGNSNLFDNGTNVGIGTVAPAHPFHVATNAAISARVENSLASGDGLWGINTAAANTQAGAGLIGISFQANALAAGTWGENPNPNGTGVVGIANGLGATVLPNGSGGSFTGNVTGVFARSATSGVGQAMYADQFGEVVRVGYWSGAQFFKINGSGSVSTNVVDATDPSGARRITLYAPETPEIVFQDFGQGRLTNGRAHVELDPRFAGAVLIDDKHPLRVFIQLEDDEDIVGVVVKNKTARGFDVVERMGGTSSAPFQWQVVANRADEVLASGRISKNADARFEEHRPPDAVQSAPPRAIRTGAPAAADPASRTPQDPAPAGEEPTADLDGEPVNAGGCAAGGSQGPLGVLVVLGLVVARRRRRW